jgi:hypothetical protein
MDDVIYGSHFQTNIKIIYLKIISITADGVLEAK